MSLPLAALALRRALSRGAALGLVLLALLSIAALRRDDALLASALDAGAITRSNVWTLFACVFTPWLLWSASLTVSRWRAGEIEWLAGTPASRFELFVSSWSGQATAGLIVIAFAGITAELCVPNSHAVSACVATVEQPRNVVLGGGPPVEQHIPLGGTAAGAQLCVQLVFVPTSVYAEVEWTLRRGERATSMRQRVARRARLVLDIPEGEGDVMSTWSRVDGEALLLFDDAPLEVLEPGRTSRSISSSLALHAVLAWVALSALALGIGAWMRAGFACVLTACIAIAASAFDIEALERAAPWNTFASAIASSARDLVPPSPSLVAVLSTVGWVAAGLLLFASGTRVWRTPR